MTCTSLPYKRVGSAAPAGPAPVSCPDGGPLCLRELPKTAHAPTNYGRDCTVPANTWAAGRPPMGRRAPPRLARAARYTVCDLSGFVCVERGFYTFTAYELLQTGPLYHMDTALCSWADPTGSGRRLGHTYRPRSLRGLHGDGASSWSPQRPFIGVFGERAAWLMMTEHGPTLEGTTYRQ